MAALPSRVDGVAPITEADRAQNGCDPHAMRGSPTPPTTLPNGGSGAAPVAAAWQVNDGSVPETGHSVHCSSMVGDRRKRQATLQREGWIKSLTASGP